MPPTIRIAETDEDIARAHAVMSELRPHIAASEFVGRVRRQQEGGYHLAFVEVESEPRCAAGFRFTENLAWGLHMYVDDLVTLAADRSKGYGALMLDWLIALARERKCAQLHLDSGVQRFGAHRFYLLKRMAITSHHFAITL